MIIPCAIAMPPVLEYPMSERLSCYFEDYFERTLIPWHVNPCGLNAEVVVWRPMTGGSDRSIRPKPASTVILAREQDEELQVYLLKRSARMDFFPETYVFPGGAVDPEDRTPGQWEPYLDMDLERVSRRFGGGLTVEEALAYGVAAIRETFEEAGVFLASRSERTWGDLNGICARRTTTGPSRGWLCERVVSEGWTLAFSRLARWAHWHTKKTLSQRYDTRFFLAFMPKGQECIPDSRETTRGIWISPEKGLLGNLQGEIPLAPPTLVTLNELLRYPDMRSLGRDLETRPWGQARLPRIIPLPRGELMLLPWDPMHNQEIKVDIKGLEKADINIGEPFSRIWHYEGMWRPVMTKTF